MKTIKNWWFTIGLYSLLCCGSYPEFVAAQNRESNTPDYSQLFGADYKEAANFIRSTPRYADSLSKWGQDPWFALAIVFPEILRYSAIRDWAETKSLEVLYSQYGAKYADFSIGRFQMKPSFARDIELAWNRFLGRYPKASTMVQKFAGDDTQALRYQRVSRLSDQNWPLRYLGMFLILMDEKYRSRQWPDTETKLRFYATAYNTGFEKSAELIEAASKQNAFHTKITRPAVCYNYAAIAMYYYRSLLAGEKIRQANDPGPLK